MSTTDVGRRSVIVKVGADGTTESKSIIQTHFICISNHVVILFLY